MQNSNHFYENQALRRFTIGEMASSGLFSPEGRAPSSRNCNFKKLKKAKMATDLIWRPLVGRYVAKGLLYTREKGKLHLLVTMEK